MTQRQKALFRLLIVFSTIGGARLASAALMTDPASLPQLGGEEPCGMSSASCSTVPPFWRLERDPGPRQPGDQLDPTDGIAAPGPSSSGFSMTLGAAIDAPLLFLPPLLVAFVTTRDGVILPNPFPSRLLRPPRWAAIAA